MLYDFKILQKILFNEFYYTLNINIDNLLKFDIQRYYER